MVDISRMAATRTLTTRPFGAYGWLEEALDLPITSALADLLANGATPC